MAAGEGAMRSRKSMEARGDLTSGIAQTIKPRGPHRRADLGPRGIRAISAGTSLYPRGDRARIVVIAPEYRGSIATAAPSTTPSTTAEPKWTMW
jgi:hypothetical protein